MQRRTLLKHTGIGTAALVSAGFAGCTGGNGGGGTTPPADGDTPMMTDGGGGKTQPPVPDLEVSDRTLESAVDGLSIIGYRDEYVAGGRHPDIHFAVTPAVKNNGSRETDLQNYRYEVALYDADDTDVTPGDSWTEEAVSVEPGETGTILVQVSFIDSDVDPTNVDRYEVTLTCGSNSKGSYC